MANLKLLAIYRDPIFSNNAIEADRLILERAVAEIQAGAKFPLAVEFVEEAAAAGLRGEYDFVLTMAQRESTLAALEEKFPRAVVWNSSAAIRNCYRMNMSRCLIDQPVGYVPFVVMNTSAASLPALEKGRAYWVKRSDFHALNNDDVSLAADENEILAKLAAFRERGVTEVILQPHIEGDTYKFYGVRGKFFRPIRVKGTLPEGTKVNLNELERVASVSAEALGVVIYGGDAIVDSAGKIHLIDLNDWPSFRLCRDEAARAIAELSLPALEKIRGGSRLPSLAASFLL